MRAARATWAGALLLLAGCSGHDDIRTRYQLERMMWRAQFHQRRVNIAILGASMGDTQDAIQAYRRVVAADPFAGSPRADWDPAVSADIRELLVSARVALANLYFATERYTDAGTLYTETLSLGSMNFKDVLDARMGAARASYMEGDQRRVMEQCAGIFRDVQASPDFWAGKGHIDDVFLNIPVTLVRLQTDAGEGAAADSAASEALAFYRRVSHTWPGSRLDWQSRLAVAQLHMVRGEWRAADDDLEKIIADTGQQAGDGASLELVLAEIHAFRLADTAGGAQRFESVRSRYAGTVAAFAAGYDLAALRLAQSDPSGAARQFQELERAPGVPAAVASRAMLARARILESSGSWDDAYALLRRLEQMYPFTTAAIEAPLVVTRHYVNEGNAAMVDVAMTHAGEYYNSLLDRRSAFPGNRLVVQSALAESFVTAGRADEAARLLGAGSQSWDEVSTAAGMLKAAELYGRVLHRPDDARATLEKVIDRFPDTRYARTARQRLDALAAGS
ncbi:MAG TPA: tetratricopeptide repeat protein [Candidatus Krumholzibacteria bacterium]